MRKRLRVIILLGAVLAIMSGSVVTPKATMQSERTLVGEWIMRSTPLDGQMFSRLGNSLGFPDRDMVFTQNGDLRDGVVLREDQGPNVRPLGAWRMVGERFSATFQLWCPDSNGPCGSVIMRGKFLDDDSVKGTMTVFFDVGDGTRPTGYDTWVFSFRGNRKTGGSN
jgi:hypothetical protein